MKIRLKTGRAGPDMAHAAGDVIDVPTKEARRMVDRGIAEYVRKPAPERAVPRAGPEKAAK